MQWFAPSEIQCRCGHADCSAPTEFVPLLAAHLDMLRTRFGHPLIVTSGLRCAAHNEHVGGAPDSAHLTGEAVDLACLDSAMRRQLVQIGLDLFDFIEVAPHHVHYDVRARGAQMLAVGNG